MSERFTTERRYELLAHAERDELIALADAILAENAPFSLVSGPTSVSVPLRAPIPGTTSATTVLGHLAATTCRAELAGARGDGFRSGRDPEGAIAAAVCDAFAEHARDGRVDQLCARTAEELSRQAAARADVVSGTTIQGGQS